MRSCAKRASKPNAKCQASASRRWLHTNLCGEIPQLRRHKRIGARKEVVENEKCDPVLEMSSSGADHFGAISVARNLCDFGLVCRGVDDWLASLRIKFVAQNHAIAATISGYTKVIVRFDRHGDGEGFQAEVKRPSRWSTQRGLTQARHGKGV